MLYYATSNNLCFCTTLQNGKNENHIFQSNAVLVESAIQQLDCVARTTYKCAVFLKEKMSSVICLIAPNICRDSRISH